MITTADVPMTEAVTDLPFDEWLDTIWRRPTITLDGSFAAIEDDRVVCITMLARQHRARPRLQRIHGNAAGVPTAAGSRRR